MTDHVTTNKAKPSASADRYLQPHQARSGSPTAFENDLGDAIETAYAAGIHDLDGLVGYLQANGPAPDGGGSWTSEVFTEFMKELGA